ncbi:hypothetical protein T310_8754, partial [Rasamsonia emersonii CBS 393.64]
ERWWRDSQAQSPEVEGAVAPQWTPLPGARCPHRSCPFSNSRPIDPDTNPCSEILARLHRTCMRRYLYLLSWICGTLSTSITRARSETIARRPNLTTVKAVP